MNEEKTHLSASLYHIISYHIISYHITSYHIISYHIISYHIISYHIISYHIIKTTVTFPQKETIPFGAAHTYLAYQGDTPPPGLDPKTQKSPWRSAINIIWYTKPPQCTFFSLDAWLIFHHCVYELLHDKDFLFPSSACHQ